MRRDDDIYSCYGRYFGLRDDVPEGCRDCKNLTIMPRRTRNYTIPSPRPCYDPRDKEAPNA